MCTEGYHTAEAVLIDVFLLFAFLLFFGASDNKKRCWRDADCFNYYLGDDILMQRTGSTRTFSDDFP